MSTPPAKLYKEQIELLQSRRLVIHDLSAAERALAHLNYYRLQLYSEPFVNPEQKPLFKEGASLSQILELYGFDQKLREWTLAASKLIEVSVRSRLAYVIGHRLGPTGYLNIHNYKRHEKAIRTLAGIRAEIMRSKEPFLAPYINEEQGFNRLPIWIAVEAFSFGSTSKVYGNLADADLQREIAETYGLNEVVMTAALHHLNTARNLVAHHARFWNLNIQEKLRLPNRDPGDLRRSLVHDANAPGCYNTLVFLNHFVRHIEPQSPLPADLRELLGQLPEELRPKAGIPSDWRARPLWSLPGD